MRSGAGGRVVGRIGVKAKDADAAHAMGTLVGAVPLVAGPLERMRAAEREER